MAQSKNDQSLRFTFSKEGNVVNFLFVNSQNDPVTYEEFLKHLENDESFRTMLTETINNQNLKGFYWECVPVSFATLSTTFFTFVLIPTTFNKFADPKDFVDKFEQQNSNKTISFKNKSGDADLVVPRPSEEESNEPFLHLASFLKNTSKEIKDNLWQTVAITLKKRLQESKNEPIWLSTHGEGVDWLHIRLDKNPKYYQHSKFKTFSASNESWALDTGFHIQESKNEPVWLSTHEGEELDTGFHIKIHLFLLTCIVVFLIAASIFLVGDVPLLVVAIIGMTSCMSLGAYLFFMDPNKSVDAIVGNPDSNATIKQTAEISEEPIFNM